MNNSDPSKISHFRKISIIGQGYVGLPLSIAASSISKVVGIDSDKNKVESLNSGKSFIEDIPDLIIQRIIKDGSYHATTDFEQATGSDVIVFCVPTPLDINKLPDLSFLESAIKSVAKYISKDTLLILESTVAPGTTRTFFTSKIELYSGLKSFEIQVAFSPERIDPMNKSWNIRNTPKLVAGLSVKSSKKAYDFYSQFIDLVFECSSIEVVEAAKLLENSFRLINISFINEFAIFCHKMGIDVLEVIEAAKTKPYGFMPFYPSLGAGGHCIPVDPIYLTHKANQIGAPQKMITLAEKINQELPEFFLSLAKKKLNGLAGKKILVIGVAYKPDVADVRETPVEELITMLRQSGANTDWNDDLVKVWNGEESHPISDDYDLAIIATPHTNLNLEKLQSVPIINTRDFSS